MDSRQALYQQLQQSIQQTLQQLVMFGQTAGSGTAAQLPPQAQFYLQNQVRPLKNCNHIITIPYL